MKKCCFSNKKGSASVIVIMVMLLLVIFGVLAFVSAGSSLRLAEKNAQTVKQYYSLDKQGEIAVARISAVLKTNPAGDLVPLLQQATGLQDITVEPAAEGNPLITVQVRNTAPENGPSLRIRLQATEVPGASGLEIMEWKLMYKPFDYNETINLWDGGN